jgi:hypothetical protein
MNRLMILASVVALAAGAVGCGNSPGQANSLVDVGPSAVSDSSQSGGNLATLARGSGGGGHKGGGGTTTTGSGTLSVAMVIDKNGNGAPNWGDTITFNVVTTDTQPYVKLDCYQGTTPVASGSAGFFDSYPWPKQFLLQGVSWTGGAATCTAVLYHADGVSAWTIATINFDVGA